MDVGVRVPERVRASVIVNQKQNQKWTEEHDSHQVRMWVPGVVYSV